MAKKIALVAPEGYSVQALAALLANPLRYSLRELHSIEAVNVALSREAFDVLITRFPRFTPSQVQAVTKLRSRFPMTSLISLSPKIDPAARFQARHLSAHKILDEVTERDDIMASIDAVSVNPSARQRLHPRVRRQGDAEISEPGGRWALNARFLDFAQMGARLALGHGEDILPRSQVRIAYRSSSEPGKIHRIECLVMWVEGSSLAKWIHGARREIGVRFIAAV